MSNLFRILAVIAIVGNVVGSTVATVLPSEDAAADADDDLSPLESYWQNSNAYFDNSVEEDENQLNDLDSVDVDMSAIRKSSEPVIIDDLDLREMSDEVLKGYLDALEESFISDIDMWVGKHTYMELANQHRRKRWIPLAVRAAALGFRYGSRLFRAAKLFKTTSKAGKITRQYQRAGNFRKAVSDLHRMKATNIRQFQGPKGLQGVTGRMGKYTVQARSKSSDGRPTLEIFKTHKPDRKFIRKVRYGNKN